MEHNIDTLLYWFDGYIAAPSDTELFFQQNKENGVKCIRDKNFTEFCFYDTYPLNNHHCKTEYHYNVVMPQYADFLGVKYNKEDFEIKHINDGKVILEYLLPKTQHRFSIDVFDGGGVKHHYNGDITQLQNFDKHCKAAANNTAYHRLFVGSHAIFHMKNQTINDDAPKVLVLGDSQSIPIIPVLCQYCKELVYVDVRCEVGKHREWIDKIPFDKRIIQIYNDKPIEWWKRVMK